MKNALYLGSFQLKSIDTKKEVLVSLDSKLQVNFNFMEI